MDELAQLAAFFKALGDETRLRLLLLLARQEPGNALCVGRLADELGTSASNVSQHLGLLKELGLVRGVRWGYRVHYFLERDRLVDYQGLVRELLESMLVVES